MTEEYIAGVDEAGRGPLAGPVFAAAVILVPGKRRFRGLTDSKLMTPQKRELLFLKIQKEALDVGVGRAEVEEIDKLNIFQATLLAMQRAIQALKIIPHLILVDGTHTPAVNIPSRAIIGGDLSEACISAASVIAKVLRDREMVKLDAEFPGYGFAKHKGYGTEEHQRALKKLGVSSIHRKSFGPVKLLLNASQNLQLQSQSQSQSQSRPKPKSKIITNQTLEIEDVSS